MKTLKQSEFESVTSTMDVPAGTVGASVIFWQTGEPKESGEYLININEKPFNPIVATYDTFTGYFTDGYGDPGRWKDINCWALTPARKLELPESTIGASVIVWQTGQPKFSGFYLVILEGKTEPIAAQYDTFLGYFKDTDLVADIYPVSIVKCWSHLV